MKKNLLSVLILALVLANLILSAILAFSIIPQTKKANELINKVCNAIDLELESGKNIQVPVENIKEYNIDAEFMCNLKDNGNDKNHLAIFTVSLLLNTESDEYNAKDGGVQKLDAKVGIIKDQIHSIVSTYTIDEFKADGYANVKQDILKTLQDIFGADFIVGVSFPSVKAQ